MNVLENAKKHFESIEVRELDVPEWACKIYSTAMTLNDVSSLNEQATPGTAKYMAKLIVRMAKDVDGKQLFNNADSYELQKGVDAGVLIRVASFLQPTTVEEQEGN